MGHIASVYQTLPIEFRGFTKKTPTIILNVGVWLDRFFWLARRGVQSEIDA